MTTDFSVDGRMRQRDRLSNRGDRVPSFRIWRRSSSNDPDIPEDLAWKLLRKEAADRVDGSLWYFEDRAKQDHGLWTRLKSSVGKEEKRTGCGAEVVEG